MTNVEKVIRGLERCTKQTCPSIFSKEYEECEYTDGLYCRQDKLLVDALALLKEQENILKEYEKLSQVCFKIEKYLRIADLSILIDRIEEGKVEVLQDDGRPDFMETTIKIRRL